MREEAKEFLKNLNIAVIGLGLMGGSFAKRLRERTKCRITAFDCETETLNKALADGVIYAFLFATKRRIFKRRTNADRYYRYKRKFR